MSGWRTIHGTVDESFDVDAFNECVERESGQSSHARVRNGDLRGDIHGRDPAPLKTCAKKQIGSFEKMAIGTGNDTGPGNGQVTFYDPGRRSFEYDESGTPPIVRDGLRVESTG